MGAIATSFRYLGAFIVFELSYLLCALVLHFIVRFTNSDLEGFWIYIVPYFAAVSVGLGACAGGLAAVKLAFPTVRRRIIAYVAAGIVATIWAITIFGLFWGTELLNEDYPRALQALVFLLATWIMTERYE